MYESSATTCVAYVSLDTRNGGEGVDAGHTWTMAQMRDPRYEWGYGDQIRCSRGDINQSGAYPQGEIQCEPQAREVRAREWYPLFREEVLEVI